MPSNFIGIHIYNELKKHKNIEIDVKVIDKKNIKSTLNFNNNKWLYCIYNHFTE
jgi:hypothetical protein